MDYPATGPILIHRYQLLASLKEVIDQSHIQSQKKVEIKKLSKHWVSWLVYCCKIKLHISFRESPNFFLLSQVVEV